MIIVCYQAHGMRHVLQYDVTREDFDAFCAEKIRFTEHRDPDGEVHYADRDGDVLEVTDESKASSSTKYVLRPDDWPIHNGEPE